MAGKDVLKKEPKRKKREVDINGPKAPRNHSSVTVKFNRYEEKILNDLIAKFDGGKLEYIRHLIICANKKQPND